MSDLRAISIEKIERLSKRVTPEDIRRVSAADVRRAMQQMTQPQLEAAMRVMLRENKFQFVAQQARPDTVQAALDRVERPGIFTAGRVMMNEPHNQHAVLGHVPDSWKEACERVLAQRMRL